MEKRRKLRGMMKWFIFFIFLFCIAAILFVILWEKQPIQTSVSIVEPTNIPTSKPIRILRFGSREFTYNFFIVENHDQIHLISNFENPQTAETIVTNNKCSNAINGGFYDKTNKPIGLWKNETATLSNAQINALLNGYFFVSNNKSSISYVAPTNPHIAIQTGPILIIDGGAVKLAIQNDEPARRMVAGITNNDSSIYMAVYDPLSPLRGPNLNDLPTIVGMIAKRINTELTAAINLDGGSASAFYTNGVGLWEINPIGSLLCIK